MGAGRVHGEWGQGEYMGTGESERARVREREKERERERESMGARRVQEYMRTGEYIVIGHGEYIGTGRVHGDRENTWVQ